MYRNYKHKPPEEVSDSIGLLISILVRYPQVGTINYDPIQQELKFTFIYSCVFTEKELDKFKMMIIESIKAYNSLEGRVPEILELSYQACEDFSKIEIRRDVATLSQEEISLVIEIVKSNFGTNLITENNDHMMEEELLMQEELIEHMLENLKIYSSEKNLIAFREEGRVLVFNK